MRILQFFQHIFFKNRTISQIIFKNASWMIVANVIAKTSKFFMLAYVARQLQPEGFGHLNYIIILSAFYFSVSEIGLSLLINREYQQNKHSSESLLASGWIIKISLVIINAMICVSGLYIVPNHLIITFLIFSIMNVIDNLKMYKITIARTQNKQEYEAICFIAETTITSLLGVLAIWKTTNINALALAYLMGSIASSIYIWQKVSVHTPSILRANKSTIMYLLKRMAPFTVSSFLLFALTGIDTLMIQWISGADGVGLYQAGLKITETIGLIPIIIGTTLFPFISKFSQNIPRLLKLLTSSLNIMALFLMPILFGGLILASDLIISIYGAAYTKSIPAFYLLLLTTIPLFFSYPFNSVLLSIHKERMSVMLSSVSCIINIGLNLFLIPSMGILGAATGTFISRILLFIGLVLVTGYYLKSPRMIPTHLLKYSGLSLVMSGFIRLVHPFQPLFLLIIEAGILYGVGLFLTNDPYIKKLLGFTKIKKY
jgi:O-antigen/teichoic acid export membrane protein